MNPKGLREFESRLLRHVINFLKENLNVAETFKFAMQIYYVSPMFYYTYILQSQKNNSLYIGYSSNLRKRLNEHNNGKSLATKPFRQYELIFYEAFLNRIDAKKREIYLKSGWGSRSVKKMLKNYLDQK